MNDLVATDVGLRGRHLIEASAGTGKTYTITTLVVRLVVEEGLRAEQILVVTFTRAATAELRDRLRARLQAAVAAVDGAVDDADLAKLAERWSVGRLPARARLLDALADFDLLPVSTIHAFCQRALRENAFESAVAFDLELVEDPSPWVRQVAIDAWTRLTWQADRTFVSWLEGQVSLGDVVSLVFEAIRASGIRVLPEQVGPPLDGQGEALREAFEQARKLWFAHAREVVDLLDRSDVLDGKSYRAAYTSKKADALAAGFRPGLVPFGSKDFVDALPYFDPEVMRAKRKKAAVEADAPVPDHPLLDALATLRQVWAASTSAFEHERVRLCREVMDTAVAAMRRAKAPRDELMFFDDLIGDLADALDRPASGPRLAAALRALYPAALIDEFQDTDPVQWRVFGRIYDRQVGEGGPGSLFLIGDPKQAIYAFRGADLYAYLQARDGVPADHQWNLDVNWRSDAPLVDAVNGVFGLGHDPFLEARIQFRGVKAHHQQPRLTVDGSVPAPLRFRMVHERGGRGAWGRYADGKALPGAVADDIVDLLSRGARLTTPDGSRDLLPMDIAVLVGRHAEAAAVQAALDARGVPSVRYGHVKVFDAPEAAMLDVVMEAVARPNDLPRVRAALVTPLLGFDAHDLHALERDEAALQEQLVRFRAWRDTWDSRGFMRMFQALLHATDAMRRMLPAEGGERAMTNLRHLAELVHAAEQSGGLTPLGAIAWLRAQRAGRGTSDGPAEVRLESDAHAVQVVTMHASKGLEWPVVFCPYLWRPAGAWGFPRFHAPDAGLSLSLQLHPEAHPDHVARHAAEAHAESLRLAYVALTRARHLCVVSWGRLGGPQTHFGQGPLAHLLHPGDVLDDVDEQALFDALATLGATAVPGIDVSWVEAQPPRVWTHPPVQERLALPRSPRRRFDADQRVTSFSGLVQRAHDAAHASADGRDVDPLHGGADADGPALDLLVLPDTPLTLADFPRGARSGTCYHAVMEHLEFTDPEAPEALLLVRSTLTRHGFDADRHAPAVLASVAEVCRTPMGQGAPALADVARADRLDELAFLAHAGQPGARLEPRGLAAVFRAHGPEGLSDDVADRLERLGFPALDGAVKGFVDLVFRHEGRWWLLDYKTNHLGLAAADYGAAGVRAAMLHGDYVLQYHLYVLALHRWLSHRLPGWDYDRDFAGVRYLFVRGMAPAHGDGHAVFADRPSRAMIDALDALLGRGPEVA
ncbi:MAG: exodeoxyribonuclease V subunit beta [Alphaproteobacteria bacterium]|nr:exodeoxyribonuclease V subunit beta [Alphaproteobacteria bacterium]